MSQMIAWLTTTPAPIMSTQCTRHMRAYSFNFFYGWLTFGAFMSTNFNSPIFVHLCLSWFASFSLMPLCLTFVTDIIFTFWAFNFSRRWFTFNHMFTIRNWTKFLVFWFCNLNIEDKPFVFLKHISTHNFINDLDT